MTMAPKDPKDLLLAPVAAEIDRNLQALRTKSEAAVESEILLALDAPRLGDDPRERAEQVADYAVRFVDRHGWDAEVTEDLTAIRLTGGSVSLDIAFGAGLERLIAQGTEARGYASRFTTAS